MMDLAAQRTVIITAVFVGLPGCVIVDCAGGELEATGGSASTATATGGGAPSGSTSSAGGSGGGGGICDRDCLGGECVNGECTAVSITVENARRVAVVGGDVFVVRNEGCGALVAGFIRKYPLPFEAGSSFDEYEPPDGCGLVMVGGPDRAYYGPNVGAQMLTVCGPAGCSNETIELLDPSGVINGKAPLVGRLLIATAYEGRVYALNLDTQGEPLPFPPTALAIGDDASFQHLIHQPGPSSGTIWATDPAKPGCVFREDLAALDEAAQGSGGEGGGTGDVPIACRPLGGAEEHPYVLWIAPGPEDGVFILATDLPADDCLAPNCALYHVNDALEAIRVMDAGQPLAVAQSVTSDGSYVYVGHPDGGIMVLDATGNRIASRPELGFPATDIDASNDEYVVFTGNAGEQSRLYRWAKPKP